jgi:hypothetical protein
MNSQGGTIHMPSDGNDNWFNWPNLTIAIVAVIVGITGVWYAYSASFPSKKILLHEMVSRVRLLSIGEQLQDIVVLYRIPHYRILG